MKNKILGSKPKIKSTPSKKWSKALKFIEKSYYKKYRYPKKYFLQLKKISNYCEKKKIKLVFFIPPNHIDTYELINKNKLGLFEKQFKKDLSSLGTLYDFNIHSNITTNKDNYKDPFHLTNKEIYKIMCKEISSK